MVYRRKRKLFGSENSLPKNQKADEAEPSRSKKKLACTTNDDKRSVNSFEDYRDRYGTYWRPLDCHLVCETYRERISLTEAADQSKGLATKLDVHMPEVLQQVLYLYHQDDPCRGHGSQPKDSVGVESH